MAQVDSVQFAWCRPTGVAMSCVVGCCWTIMMVRYDSSIVHSHSFKSSFVHTSFMWCMYCLIGCPVVAWEFLPDLRWLKVFRFAGEVVPLCYTAEMIYLLLVFFLLLSPILWLDWEIQFFWSTDALGLSVCSGDIRSGRNPKKVWQWSTVVNTICAKRIPGTWSWTLWFQGHFWILAPIHSNQLHAFPLPGCWDPRI